MIAFVEVKLRVHHVPIHLEAVVGSKAVDPTSTEIFFEDSPYVCIQSTYICQHSTAENCPSRSH